MEVWDLLGLLGKRFLSELGLPSPTFCDGSVIIRPTEMATSGSSSFSSAYMPPLFFPLPLPEMEKEEGVEWERKYRWKESGGLECPIPPLPFPPHFHSLIPFPTQEVEGAEASPGLGGGQHWSPCLKCHQDLLGPCQPSLAYSEKQEETPATTYMGSTPEACCNQPVSAIYKPAQLQEMGAGEKAEKVEGSSFLFSRHLKPPLDWSRLGSQDGWCPWLGLCWESPLLTPPRNISLWITRCPLPQWQGLLQASRRTWPWLDWDGTCCAQGSISVNLGTRTRDWSVCF